MQHNNSNTETATSEPPLSDTRPPENRNRKSRAKPRKLSEGTGAGKRVARARWPSEIDRPLISADIGRPWAARLDAVIPLIALDSRAAAARLFIRQGIEQAETRLAQLASDAADPPPRWGFMAGIRYALMLACGDPPPAVRRTIERWAREQERRGRGERR